MPERTRGAAPAQSSYNYIYNRLVDDESDILGVIAYSVYKRQKIEYIEAVHERHNRRPDEQELASFHDLTNSPTQLDSYKQQAMTLVRAFLESSISAEAEKIAAHYEEEEKQKLARFKIGFWTGVAQSVVGSAGFVLLLGVLVIFTWSLNQGPRQVMEHLFDVTITDNPTPAAEELADVQ